MVESVQPIVHVWQGLGKYAVILRLLYTAALPVPSQSGVQPTTVASMDWGKSTESKTSIEVPPIKNEELCEMLQEISSEKSEAVLMRIFEPFASQISKENAPRPLPLLFNIHDKNHEKKSLEELISVGKSLEMHVTQEMKTEIERRTQGQRKSEECYRQRSGRITACMFKNVCHSSIINPSLSLIKSVCYPQQVCFSTKATKWGIEHEVTAIHAYYSNMHENHENFILNNVGLVVGEKWPQLGATPDGLVYCDCCLGGCLEVKCPYNLRSGSTLEVYVQSKDTCLIHDENQIVQLDRKHSYYYQVQAQIFICNLSNCDFVLWCPNFVFTQRISQDFQFWEENVQKVSTFHANVIMPEFLGRYYTSKVPRDKIRRIARLGDNIIAAQSNIERFDDQHENTLHIIPMETFKFNNLIQSEDQSIEQYLTELRKQAKLCDFVCKAENCNTSYEERMIRDRLIVGIQAKEIQARLIREDGFNVNKIVDYCKAITLSKEHLKTLNPEQEVNAVKNMNYSSATKPFNCRRCLQTHLPNNCPAFRKTCAICQKQGLFAKACYRNKIMGDQAITRKEESEATGSQKKEYSSREERNCEFDPTVPDKVDESNIETNSTTSNSSAIDPVIETLFVEPLPESDVPIDIYDDNLDPLAHMEFTESERIEYVNQNVRKRKSKPPNYLKDYISEFNSSDSDSN
ncbi:hypothetical protein NQ314_021055 [Rhamnusium bicolor]|uniref:YqaJ viral recombinase domain-containing protein n=1 Tax=Rhamnusium bicolor TaxID=1586634 RepID=A0AAV8WKD3_9CUCU|nr:hypothetical protein NQ314_021055 [Rhamnusium bicolor]